MRILSTRSLAPALLASLLGLPATATAQHGAPGGAWPTYGGDAGSTKYAPLGQIDARNVGRVHVAWRWASSDDAIVARDSTLMPGPFKATPIMVDGVLYVRTSLSLVAAQTFDGGIVQLRYVPERE